MTPPTPPRLRPNGYEWSVDLAEQWPLAVGQELRDSLLTAYGGPGRHYHDLRHLGEVLGRLDELAAAGVAVSTPARLAAWFHDAVYDGAPEPERRSAEWAQAALAAYVGPVDAAEVARLVRVTESHRPDAGDQAGAALCDADLAILASDAPRYSEYVAGVREEYAHLSDELFERGRAAVLEALHDTPTLFHTAYAREHWEAAARANLARELTGLRR